MEEGFDVSTIGAFPVGYGRMQAGGNYRSLRYMSNRVHEMDYTLIRPAIMNIPKNTFSKIVRKKHGDSI